MPLGLQGFSGVCGLGFKLSGLGALNFRLKCLGLSGISPQLEVQGYAPPSPVYKEFPEALH